MNIAEQLASRILAGMGMTPEQVRNAFNGLVSDFRTMREEIQAAKGGFGQAVTHFDTRLRAVEESLARIEAQLAKPAKTNGKARQTAVDANGHIYETEP